MNEKIQNMITELGKACRAENVTLSLAAYDQVGEGKLVQNGTNPRIELVISKQIEQWEKVLKMCDCLACRMRATVLEEEDQELENQLDDFNEFTEKLEAFFRGDLT
ncbi:hypothetical protein A5886_001838 [Enterococcus sp. 8G7_MSG3316]|uniref:Uncharacterized protein n=1 Tax=Candidatus Enterococcus testudinis TaxID=1834191 RepID=A0A242A766_9ENTE|nr:hypothetical protein [Enterococcus sp. 8G7_MSG3316]OTN76759.1 hypothetical protein A5886_001838 [Enterococcus sp. 8G7_MSG3316]